MRLMVLALAFGFVGCASLGTSSQQGQDEAVGRLEKKILMLEQDATVSAVEISRLRKRLILLEAKVDGMAEGSVSSLRSGTSPGTPKPLLRFEEEPRIEEAELTPPAPVRKPEAARPAPVPPVRRTAGSAGQETYDMGYTYYHQGEYGQAEKQFQRFLLANPQSELADNAQFWVGASRLSSKDVEGALQAFREAIQRYPEGNKVPDSLLKMGECLSLLGDEEAAKAAWEELIQRYSETGAAAVAAEKLGR